MASSGIGRRDDDGLQQPADRDVGCQLVEFGLVAFAAWVMGVRLDAVSSRSQNVLHQGAEFCCQFCCQQGQKRKTG